MQTNHDKTEQQPGGGNIKSGFKRCARCGEIKPVSDFLRRTGKRSGKGSRRGTCRACRAVLKAASGSPTVSAESVPALELPSRQPPEHVFPAAPLPKRPRRPATRTLPAPPPAEGPDASVLRPNRNGKIRMRGRTDKGTRWHQEIDLDLAVTLVRERAAVVVNRNTIRRLYSNKAFRRYILTRDHHTCFFCGRYGDTIDHLLPKAKGGHTTPMNCVCACNECNQSKADRSLEDFMEDR
ncbi:HNH endonuclease [Paenibacillus sp. M1]|uniref:HNH endonuclease n=1 Tax=Paenibacillus haidiansis TaxID=1574488 RepID=A0ABU7W048_9BACL